jgi:hypothetical protein
MAVPDAEIERTGKDCDDEPEKLTSPLAIISTREESSFLPTVPPTSLGLSD